MKKSTSSITSIYRENREMWRNDLLLWEVLTITVVLELDKVARIFLSVSAREGFSKESLKHLRKSQFLEMLFTNSSFFRHLWPFFIFFGPKLYVFACKLKAILLKANNFSVSFQMIFKTSSTIMDAWRQNGIFIKMQIIPIIITIRITESKGFLSYGAWVALNIPTEAQQRKTQQFK